jgi:hypothetical protein
LKDYIPFLLANDSLTGHVGFFSEESLLRQLFYQKIKKDALTKHSEVSFHGVEDAASINKIYNQLGQVSLFEKQHIHLIFLSSDSVQTERKRKIFKKLHVDFPDQTIVWVGDFLYQQRFKKLMPDHTQKVTPPQIQRASDLGPLVNLISDYLHFSVSLECWTQTFQAFPSSLSHSFYEAVKLTLLHEMGDVGSPIDPHPPQVNIFNFVKQLTLPGISSDKLIHQAIRNASELGDWFPLLGLFFGFAGKQLSHPQTSWEQVAFIDQALKHFVPRHQVNQTFEFSIVQLHKAFRADNIRQRRSL